MAITEVRFLFPNDRGIPSEVTRRLVFFYSTGVLHRIVGRLRFDGAPGRPVVAPPRSESGRNLLVLLRIRRRLVPQRVARRRRPRRRQVRLRQSVGFGSVRRTVIGRTSQANHQEWTERWGRRRTIPLVTLSRHEIERLQR